MCPLPSPPHSSCVRCVFFSLAHSFSAYLTHRCAQCSTWIHRASMNRVRYGELEFTKNERSLGRFARGKATAMSLANWSTLAFEFAAYEFDRMLERVKRLSNECVSAAGSMHRRGWRMEDYCVTCGGDGESFISEVFVCSCARICRILLITTLCHKPYSLLWR